jgi:hypothetical protein
MKYALRPLTIAELLDRTFAFYRSHFVLFLGIAALPNLLPLVLSLALITARPTNTNFTFAIASTLLTAFLYLVTAAFSQGATIVAVSRIQLDQPTSVGEAFSTIRHRVGELVLLTLNIGIRVGLALLLLIVPGIILGLMYALAVPVAVLEGRGIRASLTRSSELTKGHRGRIFLIYFLLVTLTIIISLIWQAPLGVALAMAGPAARNPQSVMWFQVLSQFGGFLTRSLVGPVLTIALAVLYYDERVRKEAFDLEHMMRQIDGFAPSTPNA